MFDISQVLEFAKMDHSLSGLVNTALLAMIYWSSRGLRRDMKKKFDNHEQRIKVLESINKLKGVYNG